MNEGADWAFPAVLTSNVKAQAEVFLRQVVEIPVASSADISKWLGVVTDLCKPDKRPVDVAKCALRLITVGLQGLDIPCDFLTPKSALAASTLSRGFLPVYAELEAFFRSKIAMRVNNLHRLGHIVQAIEWPDWKIRLRHDVGEPAWIWFENVAVKIENGAAIMTVDSHLAAQRIFNSHSQSVKFSLQASFPDVVSIEIKSRHGCRGSRPYSDMI